MNTKGEIPSSKEVQKKAMRVVKLTGSNYGSTKITVTTPGGELECVIANKASVVLLKEFFATILKTPVSKLSSGSMARRWERRARTRWD
jgi:hypothetical protein